MQYCIKICQNLYDTKPFGLVVLILQKHKKVM